MYVNKLDQYFAGLVLPCVHVVQTTGMLGSGFWTGHGYCYSRCWLLCPRHIFIGRRKRDPKIEIAKTRFLTACIENRKSGGWTSIRTMEKCRPVGQYTNSARSCVSHVCCVLCGSSTCKTVRMKHTLRFIKMVVVVFFLLMCTRRRTIFNAEQSHTTHTHTHALVNSFAITFTRTLIVFIVLLQNYFE